MEGEDGKYNIPTEEDFQAFRADCVSESGWTEAHKTDKLTLWTKKSDNSSLLIVKCKTYFADIEPAVLYDVLHDHAYRKTWDERMTEGYVVEMLSKNTEIGYYGLKMPATVANRDYCNMRSWKRYPEKGEWIIFNHSVKHKDCPEKKGFVRAVSIRTGFFFKKPEDKPGVEMTYYSQSDPKGWIPAFVVNMVGTSVAPKYIETLHKVGLQYNTWKQDNNPEHKPWLDDGVSEKKKKKKKKEKKEKESEKSEQSDSESK